jgi:flagellar biosynthesis protein FlhG
MNRLKLRQTGSSRVPSREVQMISIASGKGGVGKSILTFNLAERLAATGKRVLLVDGDLTSGNLHILANVRCEQGLRQVADRSMMLTEAVTPVMRGVDLLGAAWGGAIEDSLSATETATLVRMIRDQAVRYDTVLIDHASGITKPAAVLAHASDITCIVVVPELTSLADGYGLYKRLVELNDTLDCRLILNRCQSDEEAVYIRDKFTALARRFLGRSPDLAGVLPESPVVRKALAGQSPLVAVDPQASVVQSLSSIAEQLADNSRTAPRAVTEVAAETPKESMITADIEE